jgi:hypothetical protein
MKERVLVLRWVGPGSGRGGDGFRILLDIAQNASDARRVHWSRYFIAGMGCRREWRVIRWFRQWEREVDSLID